MKGCRSFTFERAHVLLVRLRSVLAEVRPRLYSPQALLADDISLLSRPRQLHGWATAESAAAIDLACGDNWSRDDRQQENDPWGAHHSERRLGKAGVNSPEKEGQPETGDFRIAAVCGDHVSVTRRNQDA